MKVYFFSAIPIFLFLFLKAECYSEEQQPQEVKSGKEDLTKVVSTWASKLGGEMWQFGSFVTRKKKVEEGFKMADVQDKSGEAITADIAYQIENMMNQKVLAVNRIVDTAENLARDSNDPIPLNYDYFNAKNLSDALDNNTHSLQADQEVSDFEYVSDGLKTSKRDLRKNYQRDQETSEEHLFGQKPNQGDGDEFGDVTDGIQEVRQGNHEHAFDYRVLPLVSNKHFFNLPVNTDHSAVHVPSNVYDRAENVLRGIWWSEQLDPTFINNFKEDPTLTWQYFGSSTGFMRQYPAMIWKQDPIDLFDCRTRSWYIEAATSPKDVVILVDRSGSMTGMRKEIAKHVVNNILDTLGNNDFVNIFTFSNTTDPLIPCFDKNMLVQANLANVREFKQNLDDFKTEQIANFSDALVSAFQILEEYRNNDEDGAGCNQAIMLITDGVQYNYKEIFEQYNWRNRPAMPVRVFTYLIGREVSDIREVKWMACANQGYYVHLSTFAEVREQVLQYIPVMARPMVLSGTKPTPTWSPVYADVADPKLTNWLWITRLRREQKERIMFFKRTRTIPELDKKFVFQQKKNHDSSGELQSYTMMTSVSLPVYDKRPNATKVANLLGVAGVDVPIEYIQKLMKPHLLGVNGYAFIVTNNGYILIHPDLRPVFQGILKPSYNRVDLTEVEIMDDYREPRNFSEILLKMRDDIINPPPPVQTPPTTTSTQPSNRHVGKKILHIKYHFDEMKRVFKMRRHFFYTSIKGTPFSLVVSLPDRYGFIKIGVKEPEHDIHRLIMQKTSLPGFFKGTNWKIHPDWIYCRSLFNKHKHKSREDEMVYFLKRIEMPGWKWGVLNGGTERTTEECDRNLVQNLVSDARATDWFNENITLDAKDDKTKHEFIRRFGITVAFLATHSGLTRWQDFPQNIPNKETQAEPHFSEIHNRAIDEVWYKRAVEQYYVEPDSFVFSVPFDAGDDNETLVTASHAIFVMNHTHKAPAAVIGYQFYHTAFQSYFRNITSSCADKQECPKTCNSEDLACYVLDNNGFVVVSDNSVDTGKFFGHIRADVMEEMVRDKVYARVRMFDYQHFCDKEDGGGNSASALLTPLKHMLQIYQWTLGTLFYFLNVVTGEEVMYPDSYETGPEPTLPSDQPPTKASEKDFDRRVIVNKTKPTPCDAEMWLYQLQYYPDRTKSPHRHPMKGCERTFIVQPISQSNLILLVINKQCKEEPTKTLAPDPVEIDYNMSLACYRVLYNSFSRHKYASCIRSHPNESMIELCGVAAPYKAQVGLLLPLIVVFFNL